MQWQTTKHGRDKVDSLQAQLQQSQQENKDTKSEHQAGITEFQKSMDQLKKTNTALQESLIKSTAQWSTQLEKLQLKMAQSQAYHAEKQKEITALRRAVNCASGVKERALTALKSKLTAERSVYHLLEKGVFNQKTHNVVCLLVQAGCSCHSVARSRSPVVAALVRVHSPSSLITCRSYWPPLLVMY